MLQQGISDAEATDEIERLNNSLIHPIPENVAKVTKSAFKCYLKECGGYKYTTEKLIELLQIQEEEFQHLTVLVPTKMRKAGKKSRKAINRQNYERRCAKNGTGVYKDKKAEKLEQIKKYLEEGKKQAEICELMGISRRTFYNYKKEIACNSNDVIPVEENNIVTIQSDDATCVAEEGKNICSENGANSSDTYIRVRSTTTEMGGTEFVQDEDITPSSGKTEEFGETILGNMGIDAVEEVTNGERTTFSVLLTGQKPFLREYQGNLLMYRSKLPSGFVNHRIIRLPVGEITNFTNFRT